MAMTTRQFALAVVLLAGAGLTAEQPAGAIAPNAPKLGVVCTAGSLVGSTRTFDLVAKSGDIQTPDGNAVFMWSYANAAPPDNGAFQSPGPVLCATEGEAVVVNLSNTLPEPSSVVFPGQDSQVAATGGVPGLLTREAPASGGSVTYSFTAGHPGTYLYESGSDVAKQVEMGLYGALVIRPTLGSSFAYDDLSTAYDPSREYLLLLAEIDPALHHAVETGTTYDITALHDRYFTINGRSFPDTVQDNGSGLLPTQPYGALVRIQPNTASNTKPALVRMLNAGLSNHPFHPHGNHTRQIAQDGRLVASTEHFGETIASGQTLDFLLRWDDSDQWNPVTNPLPVAQPNYRNLTFKDGNTYYSGNPYLGYKGTLPTGTVSQNICGEWYFPWHSHALNEFTNFDEGFGGMGTLLRVDPPGGCSAFAGSAAVLVGSLKSGTPAALAVDDSTYFQVNPKTTTTTSARNAAQTTLPVTSAAGFPSTGGFYVRVDEEILQVTGGQGTATWTVTRGQLGSLAASHASGATVSGLANDWYAGFGGLPSAPTNLKVTYKGKTCGNTTGTTCTAISSNAPRQTVKICNWTISGAPGCSTPTSNGWVTLPAPPAQPVTVDSTDVTSTWTLPGAASAYVGVGSYRGQVRLLVHTDRYTSPSPTPFSTWANLVKLVYDAP